jgi:hypothetical protein
MQTILTKLSDEKAVKEVRQFAIAGLVLAGVSLFVFWWLAVAAIALCSRSLLLTWHKANTGKATKYRTMAIVGIVLSIVSIVGYSVADQG